MFLANAEHFAARFPPGSKVQPQREPGVVRGAGLLTGPPVNVSTLVLSASLQGRGAGRGGSWPNQHPGCPILFEGDLESFSLTHTFLNPSKI